MNPYPKLSFYTFGCRLNQSETATLRQCFIDAGYPVVEFGEAADIVVVNTCTVTANGDRDTRQLVSRIQRQHPSVRIALIGCQSQLQAGALIELPNVCWVVGTADKLDLPRIISDDRPGVFVRDIQRQTFTQPALGIDPSRTRANIKIQDGCDFYCTYCEVPYARGPGRSRDFSDLCTEAAALVQSGHQELVITGVNIGRYKQDDRRLLDVVRALLETEGLFRLRISSIEPGTIGDELIELMADHPKLCRFLHIPMQSASAEILKTMGRRYCYADVAQLFYHAAERVPGICLGTDAIVGFPGEGAAAFADTRQALQELPLAYCHIFSYSERPNAVARELPHTKVPPPVIEERSRELRILSQRRRREFLERFCETEETVLVEQQQQDGSWSGLTDNYIRVRFRSDRPLKNTVVRVRLLSVSGNLMRGKLLS